jgi:hypothetical protein
VVGLLEDEGVFTLVVPDEGISLLLFEGVAEVEEGPVSLVLPVAEGSFDGNLSLIVVEFSIIVGGEEIVLLIHVNCKGSVSSELVILLELRRVDGESVEENSLRLSVTTVELGPS